MSFYLFSETHNSTIRSARITRMRALLIFVIIALVTSRLIAEGTTAYSLPSAPKDFPVVVYTLNSASHLWLTELPLVAEPQNVRDAKPYLESLKLSFPDQAYALYFASKEVLVVCAPQETQDSITFLLD